MEQDYYYDDQVNTGTSQGLAGSTLGITLTVSLAIALPYFATMLVVDRVHRCTYTATSQGLPWSAYWVGTLLSNYIHFFLLALVVPVCLAAFQVPFYGESEQLVEIVPAVLWTPVPMLLFAYSASQLFSSAEACSKFMPGISLLASVLPFLAVYIMTLLSLHPQAEAMSCYVNASKRYWSLVFSYTMKPDLETRLCICD